MFLVLCTLLAASPVQPSLLPRSSAVHLLERPDPFQHYDSDPYGGPEVSTGTRLAVEAAAGLLLGGALATAGVFMGLAVSDERSGYIPNSVLAAVGFGFLGFELGEDIGITIAGNALGGRILFGRVLIGSLLGLALGIGISSLVGVILAGAVAQYVGIAVLGLSMVAGGIALPEILGSSREPSGSSEAPVALTIRF